ncbi:MAG: recombinase family protein [Patescibacteria group bacterium]
MTENKIAAIYCRVSSEDQKIHGLSIESQETNCVREATKDGYSVFGVIKDEGKSGGTLKRSGIQEVVKLTLEKKIQAIYVVHSDRLARNVADHISLRNLFRKNGVVLRCIQQPISDNSATSIMMDTMVASFNEFQRNITSEKVIMTMSEKARAGYYPCQAPLGYRNSLNPQSAERVGIKNIVIDPGLFSLVKKSFQLYATGNYNVFDLNDIMYERGLRTKRGGKLADSRMYEMLRNRFYIGELHWGEVHLKRGRHEPIVDEELFNCVQKLMTAKNNHACRRRKFSWLLSGFIRCYKHECRYTAEWHLNKKKAYYHCTNRSGCGKYIEQNKLEDMVSEKFKQIEFSQEFIDLVITKARAIFHDRRQDYDRKKRECINQRTAFEAKRKTAEDKLFAGVITDDDFTRVRQEITKEIESVDFRLAELEKGRNVNVDIAQEVLSLTRNIYDAYQKASTNLKRHYLGFFWDRFEVTDGLIIKSVLAPSQETERKQ